MIEFINFMEIFFSRINYILFILLGLVSITTATAQDLNTGDLLFQIEGNGDFSEAIADATASRDSLKFVHVGIIEISSDEEVILIEASPTYGVREIKLNDLSDKKRNGLLVIKRLNFEFPTQKVIKKARSYLGQPYDWSFLPDNEKMYCSELIYESYEDCEGNKIFNTQPMNFRTPDGKMPVFWIKLFDEIGIEVPEGLPGKNPIDMAKDSRLIEIYRNF